MTTPKEIKVWSRIVLSVVREPSPAPFPAILPTIRSGSCVARLFRSWIADRAQEHFVVMTLDAKNRVQGIMTVSIGTTNSTPVHPRDVFAPAVAGMATSIVVAHNHPTGDPTPSASDHQVTKRLTDVGELLCIPLLDHLVIGDERFYSFAEASFFHYDAS